MSRWIVFTIGLGMISTFGCTMGANPHDCKYAAYGGLIDRVDRVNGRVGSLFDPAVVVTNSQAELAPAEPTPAAEPAPADGETLDLPEPREAQMDDGQEFFHVEEDGSTLELIEADNSDDELLLR